MDITARLDSLIADIQHIHRTQAANQSGPRAKDVMCVAHGHILAAMALRWAGADLTHSPRVFYESGGIVVLGIVFHADVPIVQADLHLQLRE